MKLIKEEILKQDVSFFNNELKTFPYLNGNGEHYKLLKYISFLYNNKIILDLGTACGHSALALAQNKNNKIITYDLNKRSHLLDNIENIKRVLLDCNLMSDDVIEFSKIILLDIDPHNGIQEIKFYNKLKQTKFNGILICDDINLNQGMKNFWNQITEEKYDISDLGHFSGTGLVNFSDEKIEIE
jgi:predicted O-methyltransferase YrrM